MVVVVQPESEVNAGGGQQQWSSVGPECQASRAGDTAGRGRVHSNWLTLRHSARTQPYCYATCYLWWNVWQSNSIGECAAEELIQMQAELQQVQGELQQVQGELQQVQGDREQVQVELQRVQAELQQVQGEIQPLQFRAELAAAEHQSALQAVREEAQQQVYIAVLYVLYCMRCIVCTVLHPQSV